MSYVSMERFFDSLDEFEFNARHMPHFKKGRRNGLLVTDPVSLDKDAVSHLDQH